MKIILVCFILFASACMAHGQDIFKEKLIWKVNHLLDQSSQQDFDYKCTFRTEGIQNIFWLQKKDQFSTTLNITGINGSWSNISVIGKVVYSIATGTETGTLIFERTSSGLFMYINLSQGSAPRMDYKFSVSQVIPANP